MNTNFIIGLLKIISSMVFYILCIVIVALIWDSFSNDYPLYVKIAMPVLLGICLNNATYMLIKGIKEIRKKPHTRKKYDLISLFFLYVSIFTCINFLIIDKNHEYLKETLGIGFLLLIITIHDTLKIRNRNKLSD